MAPASGFFFLAGAGGPPRPLFRTLNKKGSYTPHFPHDTKLRSVISTRPVADCRNDNQGGSMFSVLGTAAAAVIAGCATMWVSSVIRNWFRRAV